MTPLACRRWSRGSLTSPTQVIDLRAYNRRAEVFQGYWVAFQKTLHDVLPRAAQDDRHGAVAFAGTTISIPGLMRHCAQHHLPAGTPAPCEEWVRRAFCPANPHANTASAYTGQLDMKNRVQARNLRKVHMDGHYNNAINTYVKHWAQDWLDANCTPDINTTGMVQFWSADDKCKVPVGEPGCAVPTNVRTHCGTAGAVVGGGNDALDHSFHRSSVTPTVTLFHTDVAGREAEHSTYWRTGRLSVCCRESVFGGSDAWGHAALWNQNITDMELPVPCVLAIRTDGGGDHKCTNLPVQLSVMALRMRLNIDFLAIYRSCPEVEGCMATVNLAMQAMALERSNMADADEEFFKGATEPPVQVAMPSQITPGAIPGPLLDAGAHTAFQA